MLHWELVLVVVHLPALAWDGKNIEWDAIETNETSYSAYNAQETVNVWESVGVGLLEGVALKNQSDMKVVQKNRREHIQHWTEPVLQEFVMLPGVGREATKAAMKAGARIASLEYMVKMSGRWVGNLVIDERKTKLGIRLGNLQRRMSSLYIIFFSIPSDRIPGFG